MIYILLFLYYIYQNLNELLMSCNKNNFLNTVIEGLFYFLTILQKILPGTVTHSGGTCGLFNIWVVGTLKNQLGAIWVSGYKLCLIRVFPIFNSGGVSCHLVLLKHSFILKENIQLFKYISLETLHNPQNIGSVSQIFLLLIL